MPPRERRRTDAEADVAPAPREQTSTRRLEALIARLKGEINELKSRRGAPGARSSEHARRPPTRRTQARRSGSNSPGGASPSADPADHLDAARRHRRTRRQQAERGQGRRVGDGRAAERRIGERKDHGGEPVAQSSSGNPTNNGSGGQGNGGNGSGGNGSGSVATIPVTITLNGRHAGAGLDQAAVSVNFVAGHRQQTCCPCP